MTSGRTGIQIPSSLTVKARPELGGLYSNTFHSYSATSDEQDDLEKAVSTVGLLKDAMQLQHDVDHHFISEKIVTKENPSIPSLELSLLHVAANELTDGVFYYLVVQFKKHYLIRYVESGCYEGLMEQSGLTQLAKLLKVSKDQLVPYQIYGRNEIEKQKVKNTESSKQNSFKRKQGDGKSSGPVGRSDIQFIRLMKQYDGCVEKQVHLVKKVIHSIHPKNFPSGFVHVLRKHQTPGKPYHRFMDMLQLQPDVSTFAEWDSICTNFILEGYIPQADKSTKELLLSKYNGPLKLQEQFRILCSFSNFHWEPYITLDKFTLNTQAKPCIIQHLSYPVDSVNQPPASSELTAYAADYYPTSLRNRMIHFVDSKRYIRTCLKKVVLQDVLDSPIEENSQRTISLDDIPHSHTKHHRKYTPRVVKETPEIRSIFNKSYQQTRSMYTQYKENLVTGGNISIRVETNETSIYLLNNYSLDNGQMLKNSFVHLTVLKESQPHAIHCTCDAYSFLQSEFQTRAEEEDILLDPRTSCWHTKFYQEHICNSAAERGNMTQVQMKLSSSDNINGCVAVVGRAVPGLPALFSVRGTTSHSDNCSFVNLSSTGTWIICQSGSCQAKLLNRRKVPSILSLDSNQLCEHLQAMKAQREVWQHLFRGDIQDDREDTEDDDDSDDASEALPGEEIYTAINRDDADILNNLDIPLSFNTDTGLWNFGGLSTHKPSPEVDVNLTKNVQQRTAVNDLTNLRDQEKYILGPDMTPSEPNSCPCKAGYDIAAGATLEKDYQTKLYARLAPLRCWVYKRVCANGTCVHRYSGEEHCIHQWSREVCAGDEIGWGFVRAVTKGKMSFSAYVHCITADYRDNNVLSAPFMSSTTFIKWWFSWAASMAIDFRKASVDPVCKYKPQFLAADGTHVGVSVSQMNITPIETPELDELVNPNHKRFDRVLMPYKDDIPNQTVAESRKHLIYLCRKALSKLKQKEHLDPQIENDRNQNLFLSLPRDDRIVGLITSFIGRNYSQILLQSVAKILKAMSKDAAVSNFVPFRRHDDLISVCRSVERGPADMELVFRVAEYAPEFYAMIKAAIDTPHSQEIINFVLYLIDFVKSVHRDDAPVPDPQPISGTYRPDRGIAYYFTEHGCKVRELPKYDMPADKKKTFDDDPTGQKCTKKFPNISRGGYSYIFLWFCPVHGHCYGFHSIAKAEGRKDPFYSLYKYLPSPPANVFYDFGCGLNEYGLNRAPSYFRNICTYHDVFHGFSHKCPFCFRSKRIRALNMINTEICEQFNSYLQSIKFTATHLTQEHFGFFMQFFIHLWNEKKTAQTVVL